MTRHALRILTSVLLAAVLAAPLAAQKPSSRFKIIPGPKAGGGEVKITVGGTNNKIEAEKEEYSILEGDVHIEYQDIKIRADKVTYNARTKDVVAEGNVIVDQGPTRVTAGRAIYNLDTKTGTFFNATGSMEPAMYFTGDQIEKVSEDTYTMTNGVFTSCDIDRPAWSLHVKRAEVTLDDYAHMQDVSFRTRIAPLFWTPRLVWPTKRDRSQGFLIPRLVLSGTFGQRLELAYFIPIGDSADTTILADLNTKGYFGTGINVRYVPSPNVKIGELSAYVVRDPNPQQRPRPDGTPGPSYHWRYRYQHAQDNLPAGFRGVVDLENFSDLDFFRQYDRDPRLHTLSQIYSSAYLTKNDPRFSLNLLSDRREILLSTREQRFEQLPSLQFRMYPQRVVGPLYFSMESSASHLRTSAFDRFLSGPATNSSNTDYYRSDLFPTLALQLRTPAWFSIRPQISARETYYSQSVPPGENPASPMTTTEDNISRFYAQGQVELVGPSVSRIFNHNVGGFSRFKHVIEPRFRYIYTTNVPDQDRIIRFDTVDTPFLPIVRDSVEYSLTQRLIGKEAPPKDPKAPAGSGSAREVMSFSLRQTVSLSKPFTNATSGSSGVTQSVNQKFTPLIATLRVNPYQSITLDANTTFGNVSHQIDQTSVSANLVGTGKNSDKYLGFTWFATFKDPRTNAGDSSQFRINTGSWIWPEKLRTDIQLNYDAKQGQFLEQRYVLGYTGSCYGISVGARKYFVYGAHGLESNWSADFSFSLKNLGTFGNLH